jgi:crotonobetainyl-CoA:carnitine CoA-transferase CaiB-like acyl-CoA transferase
MRALDGVRVLDLSRLIPGPFGTLVLADLGAQVDKIEDDGLGDYLRFVPPRRGDVSLSFAALNRGKRSAVVNLKTAAGREAFERLLGRYDVLVEQFRPGVLDRLGLGHAHLLERYPRLVVCALTGYGQDGPLRDRAGHDINYLARGGLLGVQGPAGAAPQVPGFQLADVSGGMWLVIAVLAALRRRDQTGKGGVCDVAMADGLLAFAATSLPRGFAGEPGVRGDETLTGGIAPYNTYLAKDGTPMSLGSLEPKFWTAFAAANGLDPSLDALVPGEHQRALKQKVAAVFASRTRAEWEAFARDHDCCVEPALAPDELRSDPHLQARGLFFSQPIGGEDVPLFRTPVTPRDHQPSPPPGKGEHTSAIFTEAGFSAEEIATLRHAGAIAGR